MQPLAWPVFGHDQARDFLARSLRSGALHHGYLFFGPSHVGKTTAARWFVQAASCLAPADGMACGGCFSCTSFAQGNHPDILWKDAGETSLGVGEVRSLVSELSRSALLGRVRVAVIGNAQRMTVAAQNAFLKTLEEPCAKRLIILLADQPLLPTLLSRAQQVCFRLVSAREIAKNLEAAGANAETAYDLALSSAGRPGAALSLFHDTEAWKLYESRRAALGTLLANDGVTFNTFAIDLLGKNLDDARVEWAALSETWIGALREMYCARAGLSDMAGSFVRRNFSERLARLSVGELARWIRELLLLRARVAGNVDPRFALENFYLALHPHSLT